ncbi:MAG: CrcB family protein [Candidatus Hydrogenedentota bacterium]
MGNWLLIGMAGGVGALARYGIGELVAKNVPEQHFPWAIFVVNMLGCAFFGLCYVLIDFNETLSPENQQRYRLILLTGFAGAFTTYSTYAFQSAMLIEEGKWTIAFLNIGGHTLIGLLAIFAGTYVGRIFV